MLRILYRIRSFLNFFALKFFGHFPRELLRETFKDEFWLREFLLRWHETHMLIGLIINSRCKVLIKVISLRKRNALRQLARRKIISNSTWSQQFRKMALDSLELLELTRQITVPAGATCSKVPRLPVILAFSPICLLHFDEINLQNRRLKPWSIPADRTNERRLIEIHSLINWAFR